MKCTEAISFKAIKAVVICRRLRTSVLLSFSLEIFRDNNIQCNFCYFSLKGKSNTLLLSGIKDAS